MRTYRTTRLALAAVTLLGVSSMLSPGSAATAAEPTPSSRECIKCHTDLERMDSYGAASASGAAAIAG